MIFIISVIIWRFNMLLHILVLCVFLLLSCIPLYNAPQFVYSFTIHQLMNIWIVSSVGATINRSSIKLFYRNLCRHMFLFLVGQYSGMWLLVVWECLFHFIRNCQGIFQNGCLILYSHPQCRRVLLVLCTLAILVVCGWLYLIIFLILLSMWYRFIRICPVWIYFHFFTWCLECS